MKKRFNAAAAAFLAGALLLTGSAVWAQEEQETVAPSAAVEDETEPLETEQEETELVLEEPGIMYLIDTVRVREQATTQSDTIGFCDRGSSVSVLGILGEWYHVRLDDPASRLQETEQEDASETEETQPEAKEGYIYGRLLTDSAEEAQKAVEANDAEIARKQAAAAAAAAAAAQGGSGGRSVVSRRKIEDCDGGGGTIITTYSDGSTSTSRY